MAQEVEKLNAFELAIKAYLDTKAENDPLFAETYKKPNKNIHECCQYIIGEAKKRKFNTDRGQVAAMSDEDTYNMAVHYYDEDDIKVDKTASSNVKVAHSGNATAKPVIRQKKGKKVASIEFELF